MRSIFLSVRAKKIENPRCISLKLEEIRPLYYFEVFASIRRAKNVYCCANGLLPYRQFTALYSVANTVLDRH